MSPHLQHRHTDTAAAGLLHGDVMKLHCCELGWFYFNERFSSYHWLQCSPEFSPGLRSQFLITHATCCCHAPNVRALEKELHILHCTEFPKHINAVILVHNYIGTDTVGIDSWKKYLCRQSMCDSWRGVHPLFLLHSGEGHSWPGHQTTSWSGKKLHRQTHMWKLSFSATFSLTGTVHLPLQGDRATIFFFSTLANQQCISRGFTACLFQTSIYF